MSEERVLQTEIRGVRVDLTSDPSAIVAFVHLREPPIRVVLPLFMGGYETECGDAPAELDEIVDELLSVRGEPTLAEVRPKVMEHPMELDVPTLVWAILAICEERDVWLGSTARSWLGDVATLAYSTPAARAAAEKSLRRVLAVATTAREGVVVEAICETTIELSPMLAR